MPTIGHGATAYLDGRPVRLGDPALSREAAELLLRQIERVCLPGARALCPGLPAAALAAVTDFAFTWVRTMQLPSTRVASGSILRASSSVMCH
jgi:hypothetical protein